jgi:hypothetical protein
MYITIRAVNTINKSLKAFSVIALTELTISIWKTINKMTLTMLMPAAMSVDFLPDMKIVKKMASNKPPTVIE